MVTAQGRGKYLNCDAPRTGEVAAVVMDRESTAEATPDYVRETTHGVVDNARRELRELKRTLLLSKLREMKDLSMPEPRADAPTRGDR